MRCMILALLLLSASTFAMTINDVMPGKHIAGPNLSAKDLKGKVVYVVYWGSH